MLSSQSVIAERRDLVATKNNSEFQWPIIIAQQTAANLLKNISQGHEIKVGKKGSITTWNH